MERLDSSVLDALDLFKAEPKDVDLMDVGGLADAGVFHLRWRTREGVATGRVSRQSLPSDY